MNEKEMNALLDTREKEWKKKNKKESWQGLIIFTLVMVAIASVVILVADLSYTKTQSEGLQNWAHCKGVCEGHGFIAHDMQHMKNTPYYTCECINEDNELRVFEVKK